MSENDILINLEGVTISREENLIFEHLDLTVRAGEFVYLVGPVGSGKSTLLKSLYKEVPISKGKAEVLGYDLRTIKQKKLPYLRRSLGIIFQDFKLLSDSTVYQNLDIVLRAITDKKVNERKERIKAVLAEVELEKKGYKYPHELSGGEQQRVAIARAILSQPRIILADEPTANLDHENGINITRLLHRLTQEIGAAVIMATHNRFVLKELPAREIHIQKNN